MVRVTMWGIWWSDNASLIIRGAGGLICLLSYIWLLDVINGFWSGITDILGKSKLTERVDSFLAKFTRDPPAKQILYFVFTIYFFVYPLLANILLKTSSPGSSDL